MAYTWPGGLCAAVELYSSLIRYTLNKYDYSLGQIRNVHQSIGTSVREAADMIIFVGGLIGAGKSSVARGLAQHLSLRYYDVDEHKRAIYALDPDFRHNMEQGIPFSHETRMKVFRKVVDDFAQLSKTHQHIVVDETLHKKELREFLFKGARKFFGGYLIIWVKASEDVILQRLTSGVREGHLLQDPVSMHKAFLTEFEPFDESIIVCRNDGTLEHTIEEINLLFDNIAVCCNLA